MDVRKRRRKFSFSFSDKGEVGGKRYAYIGIYMATHNTRRTGEVGGWDTKLGFGWGGLGAEPWGVSAVGPGVGWGGLGGGRG